MPTKTIRWQNISSSGRSMSGVYWKDGDTWRWSGSGMLADGRKTSGSGTTIFENNGDTFIRDGEVQLDGEALPHYHDVYVRVGKY